MPMANRRRKGDEERRRWLMECSIRWTTSLRRFRMICGGDQISSYRRTSAV
jgi:hypothetical protein